MLYDHACAMDDGGVPQNIRLGLKDAYVIDAQNVASYMFSDSYMEQHERWEFSDFPNCAPAFRSMWFEYKVPKMLGGSSLGPYNHKIGLLLVAEDVENLDDYTKDVISNSLKCSKLELTISLGNCRWLCRADVFDMYEGGEPRYWGNVIYGVGHAGSFNRICNKILVLPSEYTLRVQALEGVGQDVIIDRHKVSMFVPMMALSFMHCKNIRVDKAPAMPEALQRARAKKGKPRVTRPHIIIIEPMRKVLSAAGHHSCTPKAMHIVRGHFKTYEDKPLFGKYQGTFWTPSHVAGTVGVPVKNQYNVNAPMEKK